MKRTHRTLLCLLAVLATFVLLRYVSRQSDPVYQGKSLSEWLTQLDTGTWPRSEILPADEAIRHMGTNVFPRVEQLLRRRDSAFRSKVIKLFYMQSHGRLHIPTQKVYHHRAIAACYALGSAAKPLVPRVAEALNQMDPYSQPFAEQWLGSLGADADAAIPALVAILRDKKNPTRMFASDSLANISTNRWEEVLPVFTEGLRDSDQHVRLVSQYAFDLARERRMAAKDRAGGQ